MRSILLLLAVTSVIFAAEVANPEAVPQIVGLVRMNDNFIVFASTGSASVPKSLRSLGATVGEFKLHSVQFAAGFAEFERDGKLFKSVLPEAKVKAGGSLNSNKTIVIPPLSAFHHLIGLEESIASRGRERTEKMVTHTLTLILNEPGQTVEERAQKLDDLLSGKRQHIILPKGGIDDAFVKKYNLTPEDVNRANYGVELGAEFGKQEKQLKKSASSDPRN